MTASLMKDIGTIARCAALYRDGRLEGTGLGGYQAPYVLAVCRATGLTQDQIAQQLHVNRSSVTRQLALLEEAGFIERRRSGADRRAMEVCPTGRMQQVLPVVQGVLADWQAALTEALTQEELQALEGLLGRLAARAEAMVE